MEGQQGRRETYREKLEKGIEEIVFISNSHLSRIVGIESALIAVVPSSKEDSKEEPKEPCLFEKMVQKLQEAMLNFRQIGESLARIENELGITKKTSSRYCRESS